MIKQLLSATAAALVFSLPVLARTPNVDVTAFRGAMQTAKVGKTAGTTVFRGQGSGSEDPGPAIRALLEKGNEAVPVNMVEGLKGLTPLDGFVGKATRDATPRGKAPRRSQAANFGKPVVGTYIGKDVNTKGAMYSFRLEVADSTEGNYALRNLYGLDTTVLMKYDAATGAVSIPPQKVYRHSTYGDVSVIPLRIQDGKLYMVNGDIEGTVDTQGNIELGVWGVVVTETVEENGETKPGQYYGSVFNVFQSSELMVPNATASGTSIGDNALTMYEIYMEQTGANEAVLLGLCNYSSSDVLKARLTCDKRIVVSPQLRYNNMFYGPFYNYPAELTFDSSTNKWKAKVDSKKSMEFTEDPEGGYKIPGWVISAKAGPGSYIGYGYSDMLLDTEVKMEWPAAPALNLSGAGTEANPYVLQSAADFQTLAAMTEMGTDFAGVYFRQGADVDFGNISATGYQFIGTYDTPFQGVIDGNGKTVRNFKADGLGFEYTGFFGVIGARGVVRNMKFEGASVTGSGSDMGVVAGCTYGTIKNVHVVKSAVDCNGELGGGIAGEMYGGLIEGCSFSGGITSTATGAGIIARGYRNVDTGVNATVRDCQVRANIIIDGATSTAYNKECGGIAGTILFTDIEGCSVSGVLEDQRGYAYVGGIVGYAGESSVKRCYNVAAISAKRASFGTAQDPTAGETHTGGVVAYSSASEISDCFNAGTILKPDQSEHVGGIVGYLAVSYISSGSKPMEMGNVSHVTNCYNSGQIISTDENPKKGIFGMSWTSNGYSGPSPEEMCISNCYYDKQILGFDDPQYGLTTREFTSALPKDFDPAIWIFNAGRYPTLLGVAESAQTAELASLPLVLRDNDNVQKVKVTFRVTPGDNVSWELGHDAEAGETATETGALKMDGNTVTVKNQYANSVVQATTAEGWGTKLYSLAIVPKMFDGEGTADDPYLLKEVKDYVSLDEAVAKYGQTHTGDFFAMANDIDFEKGDAFRGVGFGSANEFRGTFDGRGHYVHNLKIDAGDYDEKGEATRNSAIYTGLFGVVGAAGTVRNVNIAEDNDFIFYTYGGAIAGVNSGLIENCRNYAPVKAINSYNGGVVGLNYIGARISGCYNAGTVTYNRTNVGGITGYNRNGATVELCQNDGDVTFGVVEPGGAKVQGNTAAGISAYSLGDIDRCVNNGTVTGYSRMGGIVGQYSTSLNPQGKITACVNNASVVLLSDVQTRGALVGDADNNAKFENNYYDASLNVNGGVENAGAPGVTGLSSSELVSGKALTGLSADDFDFTADAYPVLKAFKDEEAAKVLRSMYVGFAPNILRTNVSGTTPLSTANDVKFSLAQNTLFTIEGSNLKVGVPEGMTVSVDTLTAKVGEKYMKRYDLSAVPVILEGMGTAEAPYLIKTPADWNKLADFMMESKWEYSGNYFRIENDLDFAGDSIRVLAVNGVSFKADLDGAGHTVKGYKYANPNSVRTRLSGPNRYVGSYIGLIGNLGVGGAMRNMTLDGELSAYQYVGGAVGESYGLIENITHKGSVTSASGNYPAGIVARVYAGGVVRNCVNDGTVTSTKTYACGIAYETRAGSLLDSCVNNGTVTAATTIASGIAYKVAGAMVNCHNHGQLNATGTVACLVNTLDKTGSMENCSNDADVDLSTLAKVGSNVFGIAGTVTARPATAEGETLEGGYIRNCHNSGSFKGGSYLLGGFNKVNGGWTITDCYNTGDMTSVNSGSSSGYANGFASTIAGDSKNGIPTVVERCYNTGDIVGNAAGTSGLINELSNFGVVRDCYNTGNVTSNNASGLTAAGLIGKVNGVVERCYNTGDVFSAGYAVGGLAGYIASGAKEMPASMTDCFNTGNVISTYSGTNTNGNAGGLIGYLSTADEENPHSVVRCYNTGNVIGMRRVAGLSAGAFRPWSTVRDCFNSGKVICLVQDKTSSGDLRYFWSGTTFTNSYNYTTKTDTTFMLSGHSNCFYDVEMNPGAEFRSVPGSRKTTAQLKELEIAEGFTRHDFGGYPVLAVYSDTESPAYKASQAAASMLLISAEKEGESYQNITESISLVGPAGAVWTAVDIEYDEKGYPYVKGDASQAPALAARAEGETPASRLVIADGVARPVATGAVMLTCTLDGFKKDFILNVTAVPAGVDDLFGGKEVRSTDLYDLNGRPAVAPVPGQLYILRTTYTDGTTRTEKKIAR